MSDIDPRLIKAVAKALERTRQSQARRLFQEGPPLSDAQIERQRAQAAIKAITDTGALILEPVAFDALTAGDRYVDGGLRTRRDYGYSWASAVEADAHLEEEPRRTVYRLVNEKESEL